MDQLIGHKRKAKEMESKESKVLAVVDIYEGKISRQTTGGCCVVSIIQCTSQDSKETRACPQGSWMCNLKGKAAGMVVGQMGGKDALQVPVCIVVHVKGSCMHFHPMNMHMPH